jgi:TPR repeat protein/preprotein translocase subunit SecG
MSKPRQINNNFEIEINNNDTNIKIAAVVTKKKKKKNVTTTKTKGTQKTTTPLTSLTRLAWTLTTVFILICILIEFSALSSSSSSLHLTSATATATATSVVDDSSSIIGDKEEEEEGGGGEGGGVEQKCDVDDIDNNIDGTCTPTPISTKTTRDIGIDEDDDDKYYDDDDDDDYVDDDDNDDDDDYGYNENDGEDDKISSDKSESNISTSTTTTTSKNHNLPQQPSSSSASSTASSTNDHDATALTDSDADSNSDSYKLSFSMNEILQLKPSDLPPPFLFNDFGSPTSISIDVEEKEEANTITTTTGTTKLIKILPGSIMQQNIAAATNNAQNNDTPTTTTTSNKEFESKLYVLPDFMPRDTVKEILTLLRGHENMTIANGYQSIALNEDPDPVDAMTSQRIFLDDDSNNRSPKQSTIEQIQLRQKLKLLMDPYKDIMTLFLRKWYSNKCGKDNRKCTPCYTFLRRYRGGERRGNVPHHDSMSYISVVISLSDYDTEYQGGLYVSSKNSERNYIKLNRGDAVVHQWDLHHGVHVLDENIHGDTSERWSWIFWTRDSDTCDDHSNEWYKDCADDGNPSCMYLRATNEGTDEGRIKWNEKASNAGDALASVKLGYAYLKLLPSDIVSYDVKKAESLFLKAIRSSNEPDGHYALASLYLKQVTHQIQNSISMIKKQTNGDTTGDSNNDRQVKMEIMDVLKKGLISPKLINAIGHLEEAAKCGHMFAQFNLGIVHLYGYGRSYRSGDGNGNGNTDPNMAGMWFEASGLPEGYIVKSMHSNSIGNKKEAESFQQKAYTLGYGSPWRQMARERAGSGGSSGAKLNLQWPPIPSGQIPQEF